MYSWEINKMVVSETTHARYAITYFDPEDEEGMRMKTWEFGTREDAEAWRRELEVVWETPEGEIKIDAVGRGDVFLGSVH